MGDKDVRDHYHIGEGLLAGLVVPLSISVTIPRPARFARTGHIDSTPLLSKRNPYLAGAGIGSRKLRMIIKVTHVSVQTQWFAWSVPSNRSPGPVTATWSAALFSASLLIAMPRWSHDNISPPETHHTTLLHLRADARHQEPHLRSDATIVPDSGIQAVAQHVSRCESLR